MVVVVVVVVVEAPVVVIVLLICCTSLRVMRENIALTYSAVSSRSVSTSLVSVCQL